MEELSCLYQFSVCKSSDTSCIIYYLLMLSVCWLNLQQTEAGCWMVGGCELVIYLLHWVLVRSPGSGGFCPRDIMACVASVGKVCHPRRITAVSSMAMVVFVCVSRDSWNSTYPLTVVSCSVSLHWGIGVCSLRSQCVSSLRSRWVSAAVHSLYWYAMANTFHIKTRCSLHHYFMLFRSKAQWKTVPFSLINDVEQLKLILLVILVIS